jgi:hypothetical protein
MSQAGLERMAIFEFHITNVLSGKAHTSNDRPIAGGIFALTPQYRIIDQSTFDDARRNILLDDYNLQAIGPEPSQVEIWPTELLISVETKPWESLAGTLPIGWVGKEIYRGLINDSLAFQLFDSSVVSYFAGNSIDFFDRMFNYHSDEQCGQVHGAVSIDFVPIPVFRGERRSRRFISRNDSQ